MSTEKSASQVAYELLQEAYNEFEAKNYNVALQLCQAAFAIYEGIEDQVGIGCTLTNIGNIYRKQAVEFYEQALSEFKENNIQISEESEQTRISSLNSSLAWYASDKGNVIELKPIPRTSPNPSFFFKRSITIIESGARRRFSSDGQGDGGRRPSSSGAQDGSDGQGDGGGS
ncbi:hypothetical protein NIES2119_26410 [[Phormidium ambiguum] IAM M-71]|uniref:Tetratricopeptide repeat protein n=1 Tax=[Phormidium ambiguum] IAM M-71 TaxID=454136 RepID=A0A1U7I7R0_9CYAN|nr:tetratricopeptide repeat protein [Phormidium ambiguum]OKH32371.1 hypothetical protein NIES2119_26410 [Phormidium ambiguum IAM M-71]